MMARDAPTPRIASLVPSLTELVFALGLGERLVARTGFCVHPSDRVGAVAKVGGTKDVNLAKLRQLAPTHVLVNVDENRKETIDAIEAWGDAAPKIVVTHPRDPVDNLALVDQLATVFAGAPDLDERAARLRDALADALAATRAEGRPKRRVLYLIWHDPWMTVARDTYLSRMLARIGWQTLPDRTGGYAGAARYPVVTGDEPWLGAVERVLLSSEPFAFQDRHRRRSPGALPGRAGASRRRRAAQLVRVAGSRRVALSAHAGRRRQCGAARVRLTPRGRRPMDILKPLIALLAIVNPIGVLPFFIHFTEGFSRDQRRRTIRVAAISAFCVIAVSAIAGLRIIEFFGISLASFQVGGGMLLLLSSLQMLNAQPAESRTSDLAEGSDKVDAGDSIAIVPLTIPLLTGPATISTMVIYAEKTRHWWEIAVLVGYGVVIALAIWIAFGLAGRIARVVGRTGINVMTRLMGLLLAALAVEVMSDGLVKLFPVLATGLR